ncbi:MAG: outer membrane beta-barrel protein [Bacteroidota bacterium]|nr:outer membrane beta-barrel protein [Bacteroidota bacterium]
MKKSITFLMTLAIVLWVSDVFAQTEAGKLYVSGSTNILAAFGTTKEKFEPKDGDDVEVDGPKFTAFSVSPRVGYFLIDGLAAGIFLDYGYMKMKQEKTEYFSERTTTNSSMVVGPFAKFYFGEGEIKPFAVGSVGFGSSKTKYEGGEEDLLKSSDNETKYKMFNWSLGAGVAIFPTESVSFEFGLAYGSDKTSHEGEDGDSHEIESAFGVRIGIGIFLGN